ncbi:MAG TPA: hypothetical protein VLA15_03610, partial [Desulfurivibrionaceae bacterium]|nr:hypothetical protein [Desulfurivibrionaceae bacterium]
PVFFYGQAYLGSLDAILVAASFALAGPSILAIRLVQTGLYLGTILTSMLLVREMRFSNGTATVVGLLLAFPPVLFTLYTTVSLGGYGEALLLGNLILLVTLRLMRGKPSTRALAGWGALAGVSLWAFGLTLVYSVPAGGMLLRATMAKETNRARASKLGALALGLVTGAFPMVIWGWSHGPAALVGELLGSAIAGASPESFPSAILAHAVNLVLFGPTVVLGARPPWGILALGMPFTPVAAALSLAALGAGLRRSSWPRGDTPGRALLAWVAVLLVAGFLLTGFGADPSGRYFLPLVVILAIFMGAGTTALALKARPALIYALLGLILGFHIWNHLQVGLRPPFFTTQFDAETRYDHRFDPALVEFLLDQGETRGYATYWTAYPL